MFVNQISVKICRHWNIKNICVWSADGSMMKLKAGRKMILPPGTKWEDIPADWSCPDCGVGKEDFEMMEI